MALFEGHKAKTAKSQLASLVKVMMADGNLAVNEVAVLQSVAKRLGLSDKQMKAVVRAPQKVKFAPPKGDKEKLDHLMDLVMVMLADGEIHRNEIVVCQNAAMQLGFRPQVIEALVAAVVVAAKQAREGKRAEVDLNSILR